MTQIDKWHGPILSYELLHKIINNEGSRLRSEHEDASIMFETWSISFTGTTLLLNLRYRSSTTGKTHPMSINICIVNMRWSPQLDEMEHPNTKG